MLVRGSAVDHDGAGIVRPSPPRAPRPASLRWDRSPGQRRAGTTMAPAASRLRTEAALAALPRRALAHYLLLLRLYPVLAKAASSGILSALGNLLAQTIEKKRRKDSQNLDLSGPLRYAVYGFLVTGPLSHYFYLFMEHWIPPEVPLARVKRLLLDRFVFAPAFLLLFFLIMNLLEFRVLFANLAALFWYAYLACLGK
ncbi:peroxisomal membrane protein 2 isoform X3 [Castor canadensis]|uniref:Peroxisomal membrane protein 2 isoform X2 n=1 Tax=Castor canadensis TaxID=51338 RepID=A0A8B7UHN3_CASCN|nr:peroxisomal membrane protein 2 isoform X2 [Castor canadensis]